MNKNYIFTIFIEILGYIFGIREDIMLETSAPEVPFCQTEFLCMQMINGHIYEIN